MNRCIGALLLMLITSTFTVLMSPVQSVAAQGDIEWSRTLPTTYTSGSGGSYRAAGVMTHGDGSVTATACGSQSNLDDTQSMTLSPSNQVVNEITGLQSGAFCGGRGTVGIDGTVFYYENATTLYNGPKNLVVAKNKVKLATHSLAYSCSGTQYGMPQGMKVGADGNVYAIIQRGGCSQPHQLISLNGQTGQLRFSVNLSTGDKYFSNNTLGVYNDGVVVVEDSISDTAENLLTYVDYSGTKNNTLSCSIDGTTDLCGFSHGGSNVGTVRLFVKPDGTTYLDTAKYIGGTCSYNRWTLKYTASGIASSVTRPSTCNGAILHITPQGYLAYHQGTDIVVTDDSGTVQYQANSNSKTGYVLWRAPYANEIMLDGNGDVVVMRVARPSSSPTTVQHFYLDRLNTDGTWTTLFSTEQLPNPNGLKFYSEGVNDVSNVAFADDFIYMTLCTGLCSSTNAPVLYKISMPGMSIEYPRSGILAEYIADHGEQLDYVALGDSFSSGEGVPAFITGTDVAGPPENRCHRSTSAYSRLLDSTASLDLNLRSFRACSGATTLDVVQGRWGESGQLDSIDGSTDIVTVTVGGNDILFADFVTLCYVGESCDETTVAYQGAAYDAENTLPGTLEDFYGDIATHLGASNTTAKVLVIGYPKVIEYHNNTCELGAISPAEQVAASNLVGLLNQAAQDAITSLNDSRFEFVNPTATGSPFLDHDLCGPSSSFFNGLVGPDNTEYTAHPNELGQQAYAELIEAAIEN